MRLRNIYFVAAAASVLVVASVRAVTIAPGDILVYQNRNDITGGANATQISILDINPQTPGLVQTFPISTQTNPLFSTNIDPIANLSLSNNGKEVSFPGWTTTGTAGGALGTTPGIPRGAGTLSANGTYADATTYNPTFVPSVPPFAPDQPHAAYSPDGVNWYFGDTGGMYYNNSTTPLTHSDATLSIKGFGGTTYALHTLASAFQSPTGSDTGSNSGGTVISTVTPATPSPGITSITYSPVVTLPTAAHDFAIISSFNQAPDTIYVTTSAGISKFSGSGSNWTAEGTDPLPGATGITAVDVRNVGVELFVTVDNGTGPSIVSTLDEIMDSFPGSTPATINPSAPVILYTGGSLDALEGVAIAPTPEPATGLLLLPLVVALIRRRK
jgi:hypothetical protein